MKKFLVIPLLLALVIAFSACKEIEKLKAVCTEIEPGFSGVAAIHEDRLIMFIVNEIGGFVWFNIWDPASEEDLTWAALGDGTFHFTLGTFTAVEWSDESGLMGPNFVMAGGEITKKEFMDAVKPLAKILIEKGGPVIPVCKIIADKLGLINKPTAKDIIEI
jgi:hypothetical protein